MPLSSLNIENFRNFTNAQLDFSDHCNVFYGKNGAGKTSILEAIYCLILGRSFRSHIVRRIIQYGANNFSLFGKIKQDGHLMSVGITRSIETGKRIKINGKEAASNIELTKLLPLQLLNHNSYLFLYDGPKIRRQFIDWGLFHVEQSFLELWRNFERVLEQRNTAIRNKPSIEHIKIWDKNFASFGLQLHTFRGQYIDALIPIAKNISQKLLGEMSIDLLYYPGWDTNLDLETMLISNLKQDLQCGYTAAGPQRANLQLLVEKVPAKDALSRGQQKVLLHGLQIAQGILLSTLTGKKCIYLIDDLLAELDQQKYASLATILLNLENTQLFVTGLIRQDLENIFNIHNKKIFNIDDING